ncbi:MAG TPA: copper amine oxidase N-terminal domain-containing protein [Chthonomonadaceae bacterium]|nr:copper amine oxidase N-terminal domain-containing protein [Chthonomonadaceae bacterium]
MPYTINGESRQFAEPQHRDGTTFVPLAGIVESLRGVVHWDATSRVANIEIHGKNASVQSGEANVDRIGHQVTMSRPAFLENGQMWVPLDFFEKVLGFQVSASGGNITIRAEQ